MMPTAQDSVMVHGGCFHAGQWAPGVRTRPGPAPCRTCRISRVVSRQDRRLGWKVHRYRPAAQHRILERRFGLRHGLGGKPGQRCPSAGDVTGQRTGRPAGPADRAGHPASPGPKVPPRLPSRPRFCPPQRRGRLVGPQVSFAGDCTTTVVKLGNLHVDSLGVP